MNYQDTKIKKKLKEDGVAFSTFDTNKQYFFLTFYNKYFY